MKKMNIMQEYTRQELIHLACLQFGSGNSKYFQNGILQVDEYLLDEFCISDTDNIQWELSETENMFEVLTEIWQGINDLAELIRYQQSSVGYFDYSDIDSNW